MKTLAEIQKEIQSWVGRYNFFKHLSQEKFSDEIEYELLCRFFRLEEIERIQYAVFRELGLEKAKNKAELKIELRKIEKWATADLAFRAKLKQWYPGWVSLH